MTASPPKWDPKWWICLSNQLQLFLMQAYLNPVDMLTELNWLAWYAPKMLVHMHSIEQSSASVRHALKCGWSAYPPSMLPLGISLWTALGAAAKSHQCMGQVHQLEIHSAPEPALCPLRMPFFWRRSLSWMPSVTVKHWIHLPNNTCVSNDGNIWKWEHPGTPGFFFVTMGMGMQGSWGPCVPPGNLFFCSIHRVLVPGVIPHILFFLIISFPWGTPRTDPRFGPPIIELIKKAWHYYLYQYICKFTGLIRVMGVLNFDKYIWWKVPPGGRPDPWGPEGSSLPPTLISKTVKESWPLITDKYI